MGVPANHTPCMVFLWPGYQMPYLNMMQRTTGNFIVYDDLRDAVLQ